MNHFFRYTLAAIFIAAIFCGCGSSNNPSTNPIIPISDETTHQSWGAYDIIIDSESESIEIIPKRDAMFHFNINGYLDMCVGGCFNFWITDINGTVLTIDLQLQNPVALDGYDVRIIFTHLNGKTVLNPDSYTNLWDPPSTPEIANPFIAFMKHDTMRHFGPAPTSDKQILSIDFPPGSIGATTFIIDASHPTNCKDVYEINSMNFTGNLTPTGGTGTISCKVLDHQDDVEAVVADTVELTGGISVLNFAGADTWEVEITNSEGAPEGIYIVQIKSASPNPLAISTYNYVEIEVGSGSSDPCDGSVNFLVSGDGNWLVDGTIDLDGFDGEQFMSNFMNYVPSGPAANYNTVYYWGGRGGSFSNGLTWRLQAIAESLGYTWRKQELGDLNLDDVRIIIWPALGHGGITNPPTDDEINALRNLLDEGGRMVITSEYNSTPEAIAWINVQLSRLGSSIIKTEEKTMTNTGLVPEPCDALTNGINSVYFRAWGYLETTGDAFTLFQYSNKPMVMIEAL